MYNYIEDDAHTAATAAAAGAAAAAAAAAAEYSNDHYRNQYSSPSPSTGLSLSNESTPVTGPSGPPEGALPSSHVGNYTLYGTIGEGAFGKVKIAVHRELNVRVAIKIMDKSEIRAQEFTAQVRREIYIMRRLKHRHIVRMHEVLTSDTKLYIVMELVTGGELFDRIEKGRVSEQVARRYFQQLVDGVDFCHKKGVAHRDLKPENLLVDENGDIKITDFGFSSMKGKDVHTWLLYTQCGTPDYCAPEIIESAKDGYSGAKVDAWSCGIILYALLCGRLPFQEQDTDKLYELILACNVRYPTVITTNARDLLQNLLVRDPARRFDLAKVKRHPWFLVDYEGDDARFLKKRPFFNKNQKDLTSSNPSSPVARSTSYDHNSQSHFVHGMGSSSMPQSPSSMDHPSESHESTGIPGTSTYPPRDAELLDHHQSISQNGMDTDGSMHTSIGATATVPTLSRLREDARGMRVPGSPSIPRDPNVRVPTPDVHEVIRAVKDRPATPAMAHSSGATQTTSNISNGMSGLKSDPSVTSTPVQSSISTNGHISNDSMPTMTGYNGSINTGVAPTPGNTSMPANAATATWATHNRILHTSKPTSTNSAAHNTLANGSAGPSPHGYVPSLGLTTSPDGVDSSSDNDSTEDYEEKPAPLLQMPNNPYAWLRKTPDGRPNLPALPHQKHPRHRSDLAGASTNSPYGSSAGNMGDYGSASLSAIQRPRRPFTRDPQNSGSVTDMRSLRVRTTSDIPSSPPVVYSPSAPNGTSHDRYRAGSPGFHAVRKGFASDGSPNGVYPNNPPTANQNPWQSGGYSSSRDEANSSPSISLTESYSQHLWDMMCRWRGSSSPVGTLLGRELREDLSMFVREINQLSRSQDIMSVFIHFLLMFEQGLGELPSNSPSYPHSQGAEEEYEEGGDSREDGHTIGMNGDTRPGLMRHPTTDASSEEEPLSWSPVAQEPSGPQISDLTRRRNISDLLNKMIKKTDMAAQKADDGGSGETTPLTDLRELHRLMRENHGGREESNLADDLLKLMSTSEDSTTLPSSTGMPQPGQSPPPMVQSTRSADAYTQGRYPENINNNAPIPPRPNHMRSTSGNNASLPQDYVPGRFKEPNSMPARGRNGNDRTRLSNRGEGRQHPEDTGSGLERHENMAGSMGMHDIAYYESDKKGIMANKFRGVLQTMKAKNQRLGEHHAQFRSRAAPEAIMVCLARILQTMGGTVTINKETKRKIKCELAMEDWVLHARIELYAGEDGFTTVSFRRSRADKGKTGTELFHRFFEQVYVKFREEVAQHYSSSRLATSGMSSRRRRNDHDGARYTSDLSSQAMH